MSNARFSILQSRAVEDARISNSQFRTLAALGTFGDKDGWCFPKLATIGKMLSKSKQAVSKDLQSLCELGYVEITKQFRKDGSQQHNLYRLLFDTPQPEIDPPYIPDVDPPSTPEIDPPSTSEVDALTPHSNAPFNAPKEVVERPNVYTIYEQEIGALSPMIGERLKDIEKDFPAGWFEKAVREAKTTTTRVSLKYIMAILDRWDAEGLPVEHQPTEQHTPTMKKAILPDGQIVEVMV